MSNDSLDFLETSYVLEIWDIEERKKLFAELKDASDEIKLEKNRDLALANLFMLRKVRDPAFMCFVLNEINYDQEYLVRIKRKIIALISQVIVQPEVLEQRISNGAIFQANISPTSLNETSENLRQINRSNALKYLKHRFFESYDKGDYTEAHAIQTIAMDYMTDTYWGHTTFKDPLALEGSIYLEAYKFSYTKFLNRILNILMGLYQ